MNRVNQGKKEVGSEGQSPLQHPLKKTAGWSASPTGCLPPFYLLTTFSTSLVFPSLTLRKYMPVGRKPRERFACAAPFSPFTCCWYTVCPRAFTSSMFHRVAPGFCNTSVRLSWKGLGYTVTVLPVVGECTAVR